MDIIYSLITLFFLIVNNTTNAEWNFEPLSTEKRDTEVIPPEKPIEFTCRTPGMYPDPHDCRIFHHCAHNNDGKLKQDALEHFHDTCECGYGYNAKSTFCDKQLPNDACDKPAVTCEHPGQNGAFPDNPSIYYICQHAQNLEGEGQAQWYPFVYACENGKTYDPYLYLCV